MTCKCAQWDAVADSMPGPGEVKRRLRVTGECECTMDGYKVSLDYGNPGTAHDPTLIVLDLKIEEPGAGAKVMTREPVGLEDEIGPEPNRVRIHIPDDDDVTIPIRDVS